MFDILESDGNKPFKVKGIAMRKNSLSKNGFHYSDNLVEHVVREIKESINKNGSYPISMMADHPTAATNKVLSVIGRVTDIYLEEDNAIVEAEIANTSVGKDVQELIKGRFVEGLSIRASNAKYKSRNIGGKKVKDVLEMDLKGIDLVNNPGVDGARITDIIESDQSNSGNIYININESEEIKEDDKNPQDIHEEEEQLDLKQLKEKYPELIESLKDEFKAIMESESQTSTLQESIDNLTGEKTVLETKLQESETAITALQESETALKSKLEEAEIKLQEIEESEKAAKKDAFITLQLSELKFADSVKEGIRKKLEVMESEEDIKALLESEVEFINMAIKSVTGVDVKPKGHTGENAKNENINEEQEFIDLVNGM